MPWSRRDFLKASSLGLVAGTLGPSALLARPRPAGESPARQAAGEFRELRSGTGIFTARGGTIGWLVNPDGVVVVDSQFPDTARTCLAGLRERSDRPIDALINSHHHGDHTAGNGVFREAAGTIVAHRRVPELQREAARRADTEGEQTYADITFGESWTLEVGRETVRATYYGPAHTGGDCMVRFQRANVVHMGDLVFNRLIPFIDRPGGASILGWIGLLEAVTDGHSRDTLYIFGHGNPEFGVTGGREDVLLQRDFLSAVLEHAETAIREGRPREEATRLEALPGFPDHVPPVDWISLPAALGVAYDELSERD